MCYCGSQPKDMSFSYIIFKEERKEEPRRCWRTLNQSVPLRLWGRARGHLRFPPWFLQKMWFVGGFQALCSQWVHSFQDNLLHCYPQQWLIHTIRNTYQNNMDWRGWNRTHQNKEIYQLFLRSVCQWLHNNKVKHLWKMEQFNALCCARNRHLWHEEQTP